MINPCSVFSAASSDSIRRLQSRLQLIDVKVTVSCEPRAQTGNESHHNHHKNENGSSSERCSNEDLVCLVQIQRRHCLERTRAWVFRLRVIHSGSCSGPLKTGGCERMTRHTRCSTCSCAGRRCHIIGRLAD